jgi:hypothetical protein
VFISNDKFCLFDGREADVRAASERSGMPFERVLESVRLAATAAD